MRYPGVTHQERALKATLFVVALLLFAGATTFMIKKKFVAASYLRPQPTPTFDSGGAPTSTDTATLKLFNTANQEPIRNQSVAFTITNTCDSAAVSCPTHTPDVLTTDSEGLVTVPQNLLQQKPKLYAAGFKTDRYFTFASSSPTVLTVYYPPTGAKVNYDIAVETAVVGLEPASP